MLSIPQSSTSARWQGLTTTTTTMRRRRTTTTKPKCQLSLGRWSARFNRQISSPLDDEKDHGVPHSETRKWWVKPWNKSHLTFDGLRNDEDKDDGVGRLRWSHDRCPLILLRIFTALCTLYCTHQHNLSSLIFSQDENHTEINTFHFHEFHPTIGRTFAVARVSCCVI